jgi:hypothetical protein
MAKNKTTPAAIERAKRRGQALELRAAGRKYREIADALGYSSPQHAHRDVKTELDALVKEPAMDVLAEELDRLDKMLQGLWSEARRGNIHSVDRVLRIMERRARYLGLDAPDRVAVEATVRTTIEIASEIEAIARAIQDGDEEIK